MNTPPLRVLVGVTGGVAAYKSAELVRRLRDRGCDVIVAPTPSALSFVGEATWAALSGHAIVRSLWERVEQVPHVSIARSVDVCVIAPATADFLARLAAGRGDDVLTAIVMMTRSPIVIAPAMHTEMWQSPSTVANVEVLRSRGMLVINPAAGRLTGPDSGVGRLPAPESLADVVVAAARQSSSMLDLRGHHMVVSAGGTREALDPVRWIGNRSSGRMGYAIAAAAVARGAEVTVVSANVELPDIAGAVTVMVTNHREMRDALVAASESADSVVMAAAVADFTTEPGAQKIKKTVPAAAVSFELQPTTDILAELCANRTGPGPYIIGFAAETVVEDGQLLAFARRKLTAKGCDALFANDVSNSAVFGQEQVAGLIVTADGQHLPVPEQTKSAAAVQIVDLVASSRHRPSPS
jgi:phosphopantothenoylcysteine decarboxylase/phosphopantothenate--cysteine ligase